MALKFAANLSFTFLEHKNFLDRYQAAKNAGFKAVESGFPLDIPIEELSNARENAQIEHVLMNSFDGGSQGLAAVPGREEEFKQCLELSIKYAEAVKCTRMHVLAGVFPESVTNTDNKLAVLWEEIYVKNMKYAAQILEECGITLLVEPISTIPGYFLSGTQQAINLIKKVDHKNMKLLLDLFHHQRTSGNLTETLTDSMPYIGHIQVGQVPHRNEPGLDGEINYPFILHQLAKLGYKGWIGCEYHPRGVTEWGFKRYIKYEPGEMNLIITVPHRGSLDPKTQSNGGRWPYGENGCEGANGIRPHVVCNMLKRSKLDVNREIDEATLNISDAIAAYHDYISLINKAKSSIIGRGFRRGTGRGLLLDIHGSADHLQRTVLGYLVHEKYLDRGDYSMDMSSIRSLGKQWGLLAIPSPQSKKIRPAVRIYLSEGYTVAKFGSREGENVDGIQLEFARALQSRWNNSTKMKVVRAILNFYKFN